MKEEEVAEKTQETQGNAGRRGNESNDTALTLSEVCDFGVCTSQTVN